MIEPVKKPNSSTKVCWIAKYATTAYYDLLVDGSLFKKLNDKKVCNYVCVWGLGGGGCKCSKPEDWWEGLLGCICFVRQINFAIKMQ